MANKDYQEQEPGGEASLPEQVKGKVDTKGAKFGPLSIPNSDGAKDEEQFGGFGKVTHPAEMPGEPKSLKKE